MNENDTTKIICKDILPEYMVCIRRDFIPIIFNLSIWARIILEYFFAIINPTAEGTEIVAKAKIYLFQLKKHYGRNIDAHKCETALAEICTITYDKKRIFYEPHTYYDANKKCIILDLHQERQNIFFENNLSNKTDKSKGYISYRAIETKNLTQKQYSVFLFFKSHFHCTNPVYDVTIDMLKEQTLINCKEIKHINSSLKECIEKINECTHFRISYQELYSKYKEKVRFKFSMLDCTTNIQMYINKIREEIQKTDLDLIKNTQDVIKYFFPKYSPEDITIISYLIHKEKIDRSSLLNIISKCLSNPARGTIIYITQNYHIE